MIAVVPLVIYLTGFLMTLLVPYITRKTNSHVLYFIGCTLVIAASGWAFALAEPLPGISVMKTCRQFLQFSVNQVHLNCKTKFQVTKESPIPSAIKLLVLHFSMEQVPLPY